ncbi:MAG: hypothetical protein E6I27_08090 [Chloroflexi bacterium]|nr:MAG: hypothetical protein E6I27_08090 [Chloroflexota bacterium]
MNEHAGVVRLVRHDPGTGRRDEVAGVLKAMAEAARDAPGCFGAQVATSDRDGETLVLISRWESAEAMNHFGDDPGFASLRDQLKESVSKQPDVEVLTTA